jgi:hypothetical protein
MPYASLVIYVSLSKKWIVQAKCLCAYLVINNKREAVIEAGVFSSVPLPISFLVIISQKLVKSKADEEAFDGMAAKEVVTVLMSIAFYLILKQMMRRRD